MRIHHSAYAKVSGYTEFRLRDTEVKKFTTKTKTKTTSNWFDGTWNSGVFPQYTSWYFLCRTAVHVILPGFIVQFSRRQREVYCIYITRNRKTSLTLKLYFEVKYGKACLLFKFQLPLTRCRVGLHSPVSVLAPTSGQGHGNIVPGFPDFPLAWVLTAQLMPTFIKYRFPLFISGHCQVSQLPANKVTSSFY